MKNTILIIILTSIGTISNKLSAQTKTELTISVYESVDKGYNKITVIENEKLIEEIDLLPFNYKDISTHQIETNKILNKYRQNGFKLVSEIRGTLSAQWLVMVTTYRLVK